MVVNNKVTFAGPLTYKDNVGGVVVLFEDLVEAVENADVIDTNAKNYICSTMMIMSFFSKCLVAAVKRNEVALHGTERDYKYLGFILLIFSYIFKLKYHTRKFGGNFDVTFSSYNSFWKRVVSSLLRYSSANFFETKNLVDKFSKYNKNTYWLPNYRSRATYNTNDKFQGRFVFIGSISHDKGIDQIIALDKRLPDEWSIDLYGPLKDYTADELNLQSVKYRGLMPPDKVPEILSGYDVLILPSFHVGEGYPGVVIEAFSVGLPVVVTKWKALPEIVDESCGALVEVKDVNSLLHGMTCVFENYVHLHVGAKERFSMFDRDVVLASYFEKTGML